MESGLLILAYRNFLFILPVKSDTVFIVDIRFCPNNRIYKKEKKENAVIF